MKCSNRVFCHPSEGKQMHVLDIWQTALWQIAFRHISYSRINLQPHSVNSDSGKHSSGVQTDGVWYFMRAKLQCDICLVHCSSAGNGTLMHVADPADDTLFSAQSKVGPMVRHFVLPRPGKKKQNTWFFYDPVQSLSQVSSLGEFKTAFLKRASWGLKKKNSRP